MGLLYSISVTLVWQSDQWGSLKQQYVYDSAGAY